MRGGLAHRLIEPGQEALWIDGLYLDLEWLQFSLKRLGDALQSMLARGIGARPVADVSSPATELVNTTLPGRFWPTHLRMNFWANSRGANTLISNVWRTRSTGISQTGPSSPIPALLKRMSMSHFSALATSVRMKEVQLLDAEIVQPKRFYFLP